VDNERQRLGGGRGGRQRDANFYEHVDELLLVDGALARRRQAMRLQQSHELAHGKRHEVRARCGRSTVAQGRREKLLRRDVVGARDCELGLVQEGRGRRKRGEEARARLCGQRGRRVRLVRRSGGGGGGVSRVGARLVPRSVPRARAGVGPRLHVAAVAATAVATAVGSNSLNSASPPAPRAISSILRSAESKRC